jgi:hypothetical protein
MGCCSLTDGVYVWPEGLHHYVTCHDGGWLPQTPSSSPPPHTHLHAERNDSEGLACWRVVAGIVA